MRSIRFAPPADWAPQLKTIGVVAHVEEAGRFRLSTEVKVPGGVAFFRQASKDPSPEGPALVHPRGVMKMATFTSSA